jgi:hypothetical protein
MRSESRPQTGAKMNCIAENDAISSPITSPLAASVLAKIGSSGSTMPNPTRSRNTVRKITSSDGFFISRKGGR